MMASRRFHVNHTPELRLVKHKRLFEMLDELWALAFFSGTNDAISIQFLMEEGVIESRGVTDENYHGGVAGDDPFGLQ